MGRLFKPHQDPTVCPEHGPMAGITGPANPDIDPDKMWDTIYYCPECLQEEQEAEKKATPPEERTDIFYEDDDSVIKGWYHKTENGDMRGPYPTRDEALIELGESIANRKENEVAHLHMTQDSEKSDNFNWPAPRTDLFATRTEEIEDALKHHCMSPEQRKAYTEELEAEKKALTEDSEKSDN